MLYSIHLSIGITKDGAKGNAKHLLACVVMLHMGTTLATESSMSAEMVGSVGCNCLKGSSTLSCTRAPGHDFQRAKMIGAGNLEDMRQTNYLDFEPQHTPGTACCGLSMHKMTS